MNKVVRSIAIQLLWIPVCLVGVSATYILLWNFIVVKLPIEGILIKPIDFKQAIFFASISMAAFAIKFIITLLIKRTNKGNPLSLIVA